ncbi:MAG TPA: ABC transporter ATP-binding protein [Casimicrobiaceae bacterium]|jgi:branched-chain amino acid transport system ATP-binding protein|nr:ABC transporter ATP-binding protein [Casimicrobiaceae bacterium]
MAEAILDARGLTRRFGGLAACEGVDIALRRGELHALLGPNGAGKSTLINLLSGDLKPTSGSIRLRGTEIAALPPDRRSRMGIGRSYQKTNIFPGFSVFENARLAAQSRLPRPLAIASDASRDPIAGKRAMHGLELAGLHEHVERQAGALSHGEQRQLEIAMVLATEPEVLLLDEPLAGMGAEESARMVGLLERLSSAHAILLVEHDMDAVFALADVITVMVNGQVLESGPPAAIRASENVQRAYLGHDGD